MTFGVYNSFYMAKLIREKDGPKIIPFVGQITGNLFRDTGRFGLFHFGDYEFGSENEINKDFDGIYQVRHCYDGRKIVKMRFQKTREEYPTVARVANWNKFADAMAAWANLTANEKSVYNERGKALRLHGVNVFVKKYMLS